MLDAVASGAGVFEPEEVEVLRRAFKLAMRIWLKTHPVKPDRSAEMGQLIHNLGRSRIRHNKRLSGGVDANNLAEEAADLFGYLEGRPDLLEAKATAIIEKRKSTMFPATMRQPPASELPVG